MTIVRDAQVVARIAFGPLWDTYLHTTEVVKMLGNDATDEEKAAAWLHDVIEDTHVELEDLIDLGFSANVIDAVETLTRRTPDESYHDYKLRVLGFPGEGGRIARKVKLADARVNLARSETAGAMPRWRNLAESRYRPLVVALETLAAEEAA